MSVSKIVDQTHEEWLAGLNVMKAESQAKAQAADLRHEKRMAALEADFESWGVVRRTGGHLDQRRIVTDRPFALRLSSF